MCLPDGETIRSPSPRPNRLIEGLENMSRFPTFMLPTGRHRRHSAKGRFFEASSCACAKDGARQREATWDLSAMSYDDVIAREAYLTVFTAERVPLSKFPAPLV